MPFTGADRLAAFASVAQPSASGFRSHSALFFTAAGDATERAADFLRRLAATPSATEPFAQAHHEMAAAFAAVAECLFGRQSAAATRLKVEARTEFGGVFLNAARHYAAGSDAGAFADAMRAAGFAGVAMLHRRWRAAVERTPLSRTERSVLSYLARGMDAPRNRRPDRPVAAHHQEPATLDHQ